jgi:hypothetical protein
LAERARRASTASALVAMVAAEVLPSPTGVTRDFYTQGLP